MRNEFDANLSLVPMSQPMPLRAPVRRATPRAGLSLALRLLIVTVGAAAGVLLALSVL